MYSPTLGRFLQTDPVGYKDQINLYVYVGDDPVNMLDQLGNETIDANTCSRVGSTACSGSYPGSMGSGDILRTTAQIESSSELNTSRNNSMKFAKGISYQAPGYVQAQYYPGTSISTWRPTTSFHLIARGVVGDDRGPFRLGGEQSFRVTTWTTSFTVVEPGDNFRGAIIPFSDYALKFQDDFRNVIMKTVAFVPPGGQYNFSLPGKATYLFVLPTDNTPEITQFEVWGK